MLVNLGWVDRNMKNTICATIIYIPIHVESNWTTILNGQFWVAHHSAIYDGKLEVILLLVLYNFPMVFISLLDWSFALCTPNSLENSHFLMNIVLFEKMWVASWHIRLPRQIPLYTWGGFVLMHTRIWWATNLHGNSPLRLTRSWWAGPMTNTLSFLPVLQLRAK